MYFDVDFVAIFYRKTKSILLFNSLFKN